MISIITTIARPTNSIKALAKKIDSKRDNILVIGDQKGPNAYPLDGTLFYSLTDQITLPYRLASLLPTNHYARKNIGYLIAFKKKADCIYETDDDNSPNHYWHLRDKHVKVMMAKSSKWINVYRHFTNEEIWPRGFLLDRILAPETIPVHDGNLTEICAPVQQGLVDLSPDVDAIWRLTQNREFYFEKKESIALPSGSWCPFNTQSTWWWKEAFPLLYLPSYCSFRMTDIWKSFIAQRCLWEMGYNLVFHSAETVQERNLHNLMRDFEAEIPGYTLNENLTQTLEKLSLLPGTENTLVNIVRCYEALIAKNIFPEKEIILVRAWAKDIENLLF